MDLHVISTCLVFISNKDSHFNNGLQYVTEITFERVQNYHFGAKGLSYEKLIESLHVDEFWDSFGEFILRREKVIKVK